MTAITLGYTEMRMGAGDWLLMTLGLLVFAAVMLWLGASLAGNKRAGRKTPPSAEPSAQQLLDRRLAQGEITTEEHQKRRRILADDRSPGAETETTGALP